MFMRRGLSGVFLLLFPVAPMCVSNLSWSQSSAGSEESTDFAYHSTVSEVRLVFFAGDEHNRPVNQLREDDFAVVDEERVIREFRSFTQSGLTKLDVVVLIDCSASVLPQFGREIGEVVQLISQSPWGAEDKLSVLSFRGTEVRSICSGDCRSSFTSDQVAALPSGGATPLYDAVEVATNALAERKQAEVWPVIILISDGDDTISKASFREAAEKVMDNGVQVYAIDLGSGTPSHGTAVLQRIAEDSGGRRFRIGEGAAGIFDEIVSDLHSAHVLTYLAPEWGGDFHSIRILPTHNLNLQFRCRRGYYRRSSSAP